jgi:HPt (histidine-containing phosphotransfer) domain-containing protein
MMPKEDWPPLDRDYLTSIAEGDEEFIEELAHSFLNSSVNIMAELREAVRVSDAHRLRHAAHAIKGSSRAIGANTAGDAFERLEDRGRDADFSDIDRLLDDAEGRYGVLVGYMKSEWPVQQGVS